MQEWETLTSPDGGLEVCSYINETFNKSAWESVNPLLTSLPLFVLQVFLTMFLTFLVRHALNKPCQSRFVAHIIVGIMLGPSGFGSIQAFNEKFSPFSSILLLETISNLGLLFYMFLVGLEMNIAPALNCGRRVLSISIAGWLIPGFLGGFFFWLLEHGSPNYMNKESNLGYVFLPVTLIVTSFPDLTRIMASLKIFHTQMGRTALTSALINDVGGWFLLSAALVLNGFTQHNSFLNLLTTIVFLLLICGICPAFLWIIRRVCKDEKYNDNHLCFVLMGPVLCGLMSDACGVHSIFGAFLFGLMIPQGTLNDMLRQRLEGYVTEIMMPPFFLSTGLRTNIGRLVSNTSWIVVVFIVVMACMAKILSTLLVSSFFDMSFQKGLALGVLLNTKGVLVLVIINTAITLKAIHVESFTVILLATLAMTCMVEPLITLTYKPLRRFRQYKDRTIQRLKPDMEFRILVGIHSICNVAGMLKLVEASNASARSPISVYVVQLIELKGRESALLVIQDRPGLGSLRSESNLIFKVFARFEEGCSSVCVQSLATASPYYSMHEDICTLAEDKRAQLILIPFQKSDTANDKLRDVNGEIRALNINVLEKAPCSVGIVVDNGRSSSDEEMANHDRHRIAMFFIGGPDDREALAYAWRMSGHPRVQLTVVRFLSSKDVAQTEVTDLLANNDEKFGVFSDQWEKHIDDDYILEFRYQTRNNQSVIFIETEVNDGGDILLEMRKMDPVYDVYMVGRGKGRLCYMSDFPELGLIGETLVTSDFASNVSVLIVQHYAPIRALELDESEV